LPDSQTPYFATPKQPRLIWNNRDKRRTAEPVPSQTIEIVRPFFAEPSQGALDLSDHSLPENRLIWTNDNLVALTSLLAGDSQHEPLEGKVDLIYIDPPFAVQSDFKINIELEDGVADEKLPTLIEELAYRDTWKDGLDSYLSMMRDRLELLKRLLTPTGSIYVHCDWHAGHYLKVLMDEVFGYDRFVNEIVWKRSLPHNDPNRYGSTHDTILFYSSSDKYLFNQQYTGLSDEYVKSHYNQIDKTGRRYQLTSLAASGDGPARRFGDRIVAPPRGNHWRYSQENIDRLLAQGRIVFTSTGNPRYVRYQDEMKGPALQTWWDDVLAVNSQAMERIGYPTQKPVSLLQRIIASSSNAGDLVLDCFAGSGTTIVASETMANSDSKPAPRRWIAIDCGKFAVHIARKRLIEVGARPFAVENIGFYARQGEWRDTAGKSPSAKLYRDALVEVYGGAPVEGFTYLHGKKGHRWVHVGPLSAPVSEPLLESIVAEAATTDVRAVDVLSADIDIDFNKSDTERKYGVAVQVKIIPQAAIDAVRERIRRKKSKDPGLEAAPDIHFFSPPDVEINIQTSKTGVTVKLSRLTVDLDDCLSTQDAAKRAEIKKRITDWKVLVDYWAVDWDYDGLTFRNQWQAFRTRKSKEFAIQAAHTYAVGGDKRLAVKVTDIFGNDGLKVVRVTI
jgi:adenine-specific DNA-methyltransferase